MKPYLILLAGLLSLIATADAAPNFCSQRRTKAVFYSASGRCPTGTVAIRQSVLPTGPQGATGLTGPTGTTGAAGPVGPSHLIGAALGDADGGLKSSAKGANVTSITTSRFSTGNYLVTFAGTFQGLADTVDDHSKIITFCTAYNSGSNGVCTARVNTASATEITMQVWTSDSTSGVLTDNWFTALAFLGS